MTTPKLRLAVFPQGISGRLYFQPPGYPEALLLRISRQPEGIRWSVNPDLSVEDRDFEFGYADVGPAQFREVFGPEIAAEDYRISEAFSDEGRLCTVSQSPRMVLDALTFYRETMAAC